MRDYIDYLIVLFPMALSYFGNDNIFLLPVVSFFIYPTFHSHKILFTQTLGKFPPALMESWCPLHPVSHFGFPSQGPFSLKYKQNIGRKEF
jgi:hypothetical protein